MTVLYILVMPNFLFNTNIKHFCLSILVILLFQWPSVFMHTEISMQYNKITLVFFFFLMIQNHHDPPTKSREESHPVLG